MMPARHVETAALRRAGKTDARRVAELIAIAGEGIPMFLWSQTVRAGQSSLDDGEMRTAREGVNFSCRNAVLAGVGGAAVGMPLAYRPPEGDPGDDAARVPALVRPLGELEMEVAGSWYVNALVALAAHRGRGSGGLPLAHAPLAAGAGCALPSLQVFAQNQRALKLYLHHGYRVVGRRAVVPHPCHPCAVEIVLMTRGAGA